MKRLFLTLVTIVMLFTSCDVLMKVATDAMSQGGSLVVPTAEMNASGLKEALQVGLGNSVSVLNQKDGFLGNEMLKILLPEEASMIVDNLKYIPGGEKLVSDVVLSLNRAAEDAVAEAKPIFASAITQMSFSDVTAILFGDNQQAATDYLKNTTYDQLFDAFKPKMQASLNKDLIGGMSTDESWTKLSTSWNDVTKSLVGQLAGLKPIQSDLSTYATAAALKGLFSQVAAEEMKIREDPKARVNSLLQSVFGQLDKK